MQVRDAIVPLHSLVSDWDVNVCIPGVAQFHAALAGAALWIVILFVLVAIAVG